LFFLYTTPVFRLSGKLSGNFQVLDKAHYCSAHSKGFISFPYSLPKFDSTHMLEGESMRWEFGDDYAENDVEATGLLPELPTMIPQCLSL